MTIKKIAVVGAGVFGCSIALELSKEGYEVVLFEKEDDILQKATKNNHNRIHYGYHYPRSLETAKQSLDGLVSFLTKYSRAVYFGFENYYAISSEGSLTDSRQFKEFCKEAGIGFKSKFPDSAIINPKLVEDCFLVEEPIYDWNILRTLIREEIEKSDIRLLLGTDFTHYNGSFDFVVNCAYSSINEVCTFMNVPIQTFVVQDVVIPIFKSMIAPVGLTIMDGPFCSIMPKGFEKNSFLLYHAKNSIVEFNNEIEEISSTNLIKATNKILSDSRRYFPFLKNIEVYDYWRTNRAIPINDNDQRLSEVITYKDNPRIVTVFSGKVTTSVKIAKQIVFGLRTGDFNRNIYV
jgi:hypothetical protein